VDKRIAPSSAIRLLGEFTHGLRLADLPDDVRRQGALPLLDTVGCMIAGSATSDARALLAAEWAADAAGLDGADGAGQSTIVGSRRRLGLQAAARCNGYLGDIFELNDLTGGHASIATVAAALTAAEGARASGRALLEAVVAGIEATTRVYNAAYPTFKGYDQCGMAPIGLPNAVGAAAAAARLRHLDAAGHAEALAIAAVLAGWCPAETTAGPASTVKPFLFGGWPASVGLLAAQYAAAGLTGPPFVLESPVGWLRTVANDPDVTAITDPSWALARPRRLLRLRPRGDRHRAEHQGQPAGAARAGPVDPAVAAAVHDAHGGEAAAARRPEPGPVRRAVLRCGGRRLRRPILPAHSEEHARYLAQPPVADAYAKISVVRDDALTHYHQTRVRVELADGRAIEEATSAPRGTPDNPLSDDVRGKFTRLAAPVLGAAVAEHLRLTLEGIDEAPDLGMLFALVRPAAAS
jgi:2-methylcitrate dehydratase PrpD